MELLTKNWAISPAFDRELKHYQLLGYLQRVHAGFEQQKLYPYLPELRAHYQELLELRLRKVAMERSVHGALTGFDPLTGEAVHEQAPLPAPFDVIEEVLDKAIPKLEHALNTGDRLKQELMGTVHVLPIGLQPLDLHYGWMLLRHGRDTRVYAYTIPWVLPAEQSDTSGVVRTQYVSTYSMGVGHSYSFIRQDLLRTFALWPLAATFAMECEKDLPRLETLLPLARQRLYEQVLPDLIPKADRTRPS
jgi:hypothetical protein